jgi:nucleoside-diphosphate-sugar epimerase
MKIAITGADRPTGALLSRRLSNEHQIRPIGSVEQPESDLGSVGEHYQRADLRLPSAVRPALANCDVVVHCQPHDPGPQEGPEQEVLDVIARGTYVLVNTANEVGIGRVILLSHLDIMQDYPEDFVVSEHWMPNPRAEADSLAPYMAELVCRELARIGKIECLCLRLGDLGADGTSEEDAVSAVQRALYRELKPESGYQWHLEHIASAGRFAASARG